jgi:hypothetical protein
MEPVVKSFDGFVLDNDTYKAWFPGGSAALNRSVSPISLDVIGGFPRDEGFSHDAATFAMVVGVWDGVISDGIAALMSQFRVGRTGELVVDFNSDEKARQVRVQSVFPYADAANFFLVNLFAGDTRWTALDNTVTAQAVTASGQTWPVTNAGNATVHDAVILVKPTTNKAATVTQLYRRYVTLVNLVDRALGDYCIEITEGLDHAALVSASKSHVSGDGRDFRVLVDGVEVPYWWGEHADTNANSAASKIWVGPSPGPALSAGIDAHLFAAITAGVPANGGELVVKKGEVRKFPPRGVLLNPTSHEVISYTGIVEENDDGNSAFTGITRGMRGSTAASGSANDRLVFDERKVEVVYGWTGATAPDPRTDIKPLLNLAASDLSNTLWRWVDFYDDDNPNRPGGWTRVFEARDSQAGFMYLPEGSPATSALWTYEYGPAPVNQQNYNILRREVPTGTDGSAGQIGFTYDIDSTLALYVIGVDEDGLEIDAGVVRGADADTFASTLSHKLHSVSLYARSQVVISSPEVDGYPLSSNPFDLQMEIAPPNGSDTGIVQFVKNRSERAQIMHGMYVMVLVPNGAKIDFGIYLLSDDGTGLFTVSDVIGGVQVANATIASTIGTWVGGLANTAFFGPTVLLPGQAFDVYPDVSAGTHGPYQWAWIPTNYEGAFPVKSYRILGDGEIDVDARGQVGDQISADSALLKLDSAAVPYVNMRAEQGCYWLNGTLSNLTTGQSVDFNLYISLLDEVELDLAAGTVRNLTSDEDVLYGVTFSDPLGKCFLAPGINTLEWVESGCAGVTITVTFRAKSE